MLLTKIMIIMDNFTTVFLFTDIRYFQNRIIFGGIVLYVIVIGFLYGNLLTNIRKRPDFMKGRVSLGDESFSTMGYLVLLFMTTVILPIVMFVFSNAFGTPYYIAFRDEYEQLQARYDSQQYYIAEGQVHVLHAQNPFGHDQSDIISIGGTELEIDAYGGGWNYARTISHGGALTEATYARIIYVENPIGISLKYLILRVDVKK